MSVPIEGASKAAWRMLALGDSYTIGESVAEHERWPMQLAALLRAQGWTVAEPQIVAQTGWTTDELSAAMDRIESELNPPYDLVSLLIGVNNQYRVWPLQEYQAQFESLLRRAKAFASAAGGPKGEVRVLSIPDWGVTPFARADARSATEIASQINAFNACAQSICNSLGVPFVDITEAGRESTTRPELLSADGLHPSALEYARWAGKVYQTIALPGSSS